MTTKTVRDLCEASEFLRTTLDCGDNSCLYRDTSKPSGMRTNGGCRCFSDLPQINRIFIKKMRWFIDVLIEEVDVLKSQNERLKKCRIVTDNSWQEIVVELESALARERELQRELCTRIARNTWNAYHDGPMQSPLEIAKTRGWNCYDTESDTK